MSASIFDTYERLQPSPIRLKWVHLSGIQNISQDDRIHSGILYTADEEKEIIRKKFYILTKTTLFMASDECHENLIHYEAILRLRNPRISCLPGPYK